MTDLAIAVEAKTPPALREHSLIPQPPTRRTWWLGNREFLANSTLAQPSIDGEQDAMAKERGVGRRTPARGKDDIAVHNDAFERAQRISGGQLGPGDQVWLTKAFTAFLSAGGALSLERCLGLPRNDCSLRRASRDYWLRLAWNTLGGNLSPWRRSEKLATTIHDFRTRRWVRWRLLDKPPVHAESVETALFWAFRSSERIPSTAMQLHNIAYYRRHS